MKTKSWNRGRENGFSLVEVIVTLVIGAIMATMLVVLTGNLLANSAKPVTQMIPVYRLYETMDLVMASYRNEFEHTPNGSQALGALSSKIARHAFDNETAVVTCRYIRYAAASEGVRSVEEGNINDGILEVTVAPAAGVEGMVLKAVVTR